MKLIFLALFFLSWQTSALTTLQFWHSMSGHKGNILQAIVDEFNKEHPFHVQLQYVGTYEEALSKLRAALLAKKGPEIVQVVDIATGLIVDSGMITPLHTFIEKDPEFPLTEIIPSIRRYYEVKGKLFSLPFATSNPILYYNADVLKQAGFLRPPQTFQELEEYSQKLTDPKLKRKGITWPLHSWFFEQFIARQGQDLVNHENGRGSLPSEAYYTSEAAMNFVSLWLRMVKAGTFSNVGRGWGPAEQDFLAGRTAMFITSTSDVYEISKKATFTVATGPIPTKDLKTRGGTIVGGSCLWILNHSPSEKQKMAYEFVRSMASKKAQRLWHTMTGYFPIRKDLIADLESEGYYQKNPSAKTAIDQLRTSPEMSATRGAVMGVFAEAREHIESTMEQILAERLPPQKALERAKARTEEALGRYKRGRERIKASD